MKNKFISSMCFSALILFCIAVCTNEVFAAKVIGEQGLWQQVSESQSRSLRPAKSLAEKFLVFRLNRKALNGVFAEAPLEFTNEALQTETIIEIPTPDGGLSRFRIEESPMLAPNIAAQFPTWKQFSGQGIDDPTATARFDVNANGFHGYVLSSKGTLLIDPISLSDQKNYIVYYKGNIGESNRDQFSCGFHSDVKAMEESSFAPQPFSNGTQLRNYRLAVSATKEYTNFFGGNVTTAFAAVTTTVNRMIGIYRRDLATTFTLVTGTSHVFTDANDGGFPAASNPMVSELSLSRNQIVMDSGNGGNPGPVGVANYDIGHVLARTGNPNGLAASPSLCNDSAKAQGFTGAQTPQGDGFDVDYVAHEIGHQFNMSHTFNNDTDGSCTTRSATSAYEPASGVTIMGYGGICAPRNLAKNSIEYFNLRSFDQSFIWFGNIANGDFGLNPACGTPTGNGNIVPVVTSPGNFTIPRLTPFTLTASATDANGDSLTYLWEEFDLGGATRSAGTVAIDTDEDGTARPIFRAYNASTSGSRTFPSLHYILNNANVVPLTFTGTLPFAPATGSTNGYVCDPNETCVSGERLPSIARTMNFRVTVRDNRVGGGAVVDGQSAVTVAAAAGPFVITSPNSFSELGGSTWQGGSTQTVTWAVAGTTANGINVANVKISLSTDGGQTFPLTLAANTPNDGTETITVPNVVSNQVRIKVEAIGNIFFDINNFNFAITANPNAAKPRADFDGDGRTDLSVFRPAEGNWYLQRSTSGFSAANFGLSSDRITPADFDGDGKADLAVWRPSNTAVQPDFYVLGSSNSTISGVEWGITTDIPVVADYDGDNKADYAVFRPSTNDFFVIRSNGGAVIHYRWGISGDVPVPADFDGDGKAEFAVWRPSNGTWYYANTSNAAFVALQWGTTSDIPVYADYDGDSKVDPAVWRASNGTWYIQRSTGGSSVLQFGANGDVPVPGDFDGDGRYDQAVYRNGIWYLNRSTAGFSAVTFGTATDRPTPRQYLPQ